MNKQSNTYTILYSAIMVIVVGAALALVYGALKPKQEENIKIDKMKQMLTAVRIVTDSDDQVIDTYNKYIPEAFVINEGGEVISNDKDEAFNIDMAKEMKKASAERNLPVYKFVGDDEKVRYIIPLSGAGLWGAIWGYVSVEDNGSTIYGAYFSHASETPGLGAEIEKSEFQQQFQNKELYKQGEFKPVEVMKAGQKPTNGADYVDAISGGTITSKGVQSMLSDCLTNYSTFLKNLSNENSKE
ncbi:MAG: NADH:ubiquinone reductase (Na(+)-transporting) subunit C [Bacteroidales bacterium]|nr:NADH:ubiquinone reductase (Na(+)-transporting) subunit C [Bacteroidales bacterium]